MNRFVALLIAFLFTSFAPTAFVAQANADQLELVSILELQEEYNDNIFFATRDETDDFITTFSPGLELIKRTARLDSGLVGRFDAIAYADNNELDAVDQSYAGTLRYSLTPKLNLSADGRYILDSQPDRDLLVTGLVQGTASRTRQHYGGGGEYALTLKTSGVFSYAFDRDDYDEPGFVDYKRHYVSAGLSHGFADLTSGHVNFGYSRYDYDQLQVENYTLILGAEQEFSEKWSLSGDLGPHYTRSEFDVLGTTDDSSGVVGQLALHYQGLQSSGNLMFSHEIAAAGSDTTGATRRTSLRLRLSRRFTEELRTSLDTGYHLNRSEEGELALRAVDEETFFLNPRLRYQFNREIAVEASYRYTAVNDQEVNTESHRNTVFARLLVEYPVIE